MLKACSSRRSAKRLHSYLGIDGFSKLPDDIITSCILPRLSLKERGRTSGLSRRWRNLWRSSPGTRLVFLPGSECPPSETTIFSRRQSYIKWVEATLESLRGLELLDEFHICFDLDSSFSHLIDDWLEFAAGKGVKRLHLNLGSKNLVPLIPLPFTNRYTFPTAEKLLQFSCGGIGCHGGSATMSNLMDLSLIRVNIQDDTVQHLLSSCPFLERISLDGVASEVTLNIVGTSLKLKYLEILNPWCVVKVVVSAPNLISLKYDGPDEYLLLVDVPLLEHLHMWSLSFLQKLRFGQYSYFCRLKKLELCMVYLTFAISSFPSVLPDLVKLEELTVTKLDHRIYFLLWPTVLVKAAPILKRCSISLQCGCDLYDLQRGFGGNADAEEQREKLENAKCKRQHLKVVEFSGFYWFMKREMELVEHYLSLADKPEKLVLGFSRAISADLRWMETLLRQLKHLPSDAEVVVHSTSRDAPPVSYTIARRAD